MENLKFTLYSCVKSVVYEKKQDAEAQKQFIDKYGCCGVCNKHHSIEELKTTK